MKPINATLVHIKNASKGKVLGVSNNNTVKAETMNEAKAEQKWEKGTPNGEGFFLLISSARKVLTATSANKLEIKGIDQLAIKLKLFYRYVY